MIVAVASAYDPFLAVCVRAFLASSVAFAEASTTIISAASLLFASRPTSMTNAETFAFLFVCAAFVLAQPSTTMRLAQLPVLSSSFTVRYTAQDLSTMASTAFVYLPDLVAAIDDAFPASSVRDAMSTAKVVLRTSKSLTTSSWTLVIHTKPTSGRPVFAVVGQALLATTMGLTVPATSVDLGAILRLAFLPTSV